MAKNKKNKQPKSDFRTFHRTHPDHIIDEDGCVVDDAQVDRIMLELIDMIIHLNATEQEMYVEKFPQVIDAILENKLTDLVNFKPSTLGRSVGFVTENKYLHHDYNMQEMMRMASADKLKLAVMNEGIKRCLDQYYIEHPDDYPNLDREKKDIKKVIDWVYEEYGRREYNKTIAGYPTRKFLSNALRAYDKTLGESVYTTPFNGWKMQISVTDGHFRQLAMDDRFVYLTMPFIDWEKYDPENTKRKTAPTKRYTLAFRIPNKPFFHADDLKPCAPDIIYRCGRKGPFLDFAISLMRPNEYVDYDKRTCVAVDSGVARKATFGVVHMDDVNEFAISTTLFTSKKIEALEARNEHRKVNIASLKRLIAEDAYYENYDALRVHENELSHVYARVKSTKRELNRQYAYAIVSLAYLARGYVALEELSWSDPRQDWDRAALEREVRVVAARFGVSVKSVNPAFTSQSCPLCAGELVFDADSRVVSCVNGDYVANRDDTGELNIGVFSLLEENGVKPRRRAKKDNDAVMSDGVSDSDKEEESDDAGGVLLCHRSFVSYSFSDFNIDRLVKRGVRASTGRKPLSVRQISQILTKDGPKQANNNKTGLPSYTRK